MKLTVHRGAHEIGGSCLELTLASGQRLILDAGRPLDASKDATGLLPTSLDLSRPADVLISHAHQDHWGLINELPGDWPIWTGKAAAELIALTADISGRPLVRDLKTWGSRGEFDLGGFKITPYLTDHSGFDAYMLLIEGDGKRVLYSGDFRRHGRKSVLVDRLMANPPKRLDLLILEGTNIASDKPVIPEQDIEQHFAELLERKKGRVFTYWSGQNIDRTVTLYRAARRMNRNLVIDLYTADVLERMAPGTMLPAPGMDGLKVVITKGLKDHYIKRGRQDFFDRMLTKRAISIDALAGCRDIIMLRDALVPNYRYKDRVVMGPDDAFVWSTWAGYLKNQDVAYRWAKESGAESLHLHTSGHASAADLEGFAKAMLAKCIVPVHSLTWGQHSGEFAGLTSVPDGQSLEL